MSLRPPKVTLSKMRLLHVHVLGYTVHVHVFLNTQIYHMLLFVNQKINKKNRLVLYVKTHCFPNFHLNLSTNFHD